MWICYSQTELGNLLPPDSSLSFQLLSVAAVLHYTPGKYETGIDFSSNKKAKGIFPESCIIPLKLHSLIFLATWGQCNKLKPLMYLCMIPDRALLLSLAANLSQWSLAVLQQNIPLRLKKHFPYRLPL